jgi:hypothetical protein
LNNFKFFLSALFLLPLGLFAQPTLPCGHSHNDYLQKRPLLDAVELGFGSIEIDVCLDQHNELKVAHIPWFLGGKKNIEELYFKPIAKMIDTKDSIFMYSNEHPLHLLIDFKKNADSTYTYLKVVFFKYARYITQYKNGRVVHQAPLVIHITGNKPWKAMGLDTLLYARMDGPLVLADTSLQHIGLASVDTGYIQLMGRAAAHYSRWRTFKKRYKNQPIFYNQVKANLKTYQDQLITTRFYAVPNRKKHWTQLLDCGVSWINVDKLKKFARFYKDYKN